MEKKKAKSEILAEFIVENWHWCPICANVDIPDCVGWRDDKAHCKKCLLKNVHNIGEDE